MRQRAHPYSLMLCVLFSVALRGLRHKDHGQHTENERLDHAHEQFEHHDHRGQNRDLAEQSCNDRDQHDPCKHVTEKTEGKREDLGKFRDQFKQADQKIHRAEEWHFEHPASIEELAKITQSLRSQTNELNCDHRDNSQRSSKVQVHRDTAEEWSKYVAAFFHFCGKKICPTATKFLDCMTFAVCLMQNTD